MLQNFPIRYNKWIKLKHYEQIMEPNVQDITDSLNQSQLTESQPSTQKAQELYNQPILCLNDDLDKVKQIRLAYKTGMETYIDLIDTAPDEKGIYDNFSNNPKKLNDLLRLLYIIKLDFTKHISNNTDSKYLDLKIKKPIKKKQTVYKNTEKET